MNKVSRVVTVVRRDFSLETYTVTDLVPVLITRASDRDWIDVAIRNRRCRGAVEAFRDARSLDMSRARASRAVTHESWLTPIVCCASVSSDNVTLLSVITSDHRGEYWRSNRRLP